MRRKRINDLLDKYIEGTISDYEKKELFDAYHDLSFRNTEFPDDREAVKDRMLLRLKNDMRIKPKRNPFNNGWGIAAAITVILTGLGLYIFNKPDQNTDRIVKHPVTKSVILPGVNVATLTLENGKTILLNDSAKGILVVQGNTIITKSIAGQISYHLAANPSAQRNLPISYHTITTPSGGQFRVTLPDGSDVWLNAGSSLKYPNRFEGTQRRVELQGEAYFEIFKNKKAPFMVMAENVEIKVLGTHFNVMAYRNEPSVNTTLLEGSVSLASGTSHTHLMPGEQALADKIADKITLRQVNTEDAVAWKNGYFSFKKENLKTAMNKIARWYNVDIEYNGNPDHKMLGGTISRAENITKLLDYLALTGIAKFKIEGRRIIVNCK